MWSGVFIEYILVYIYYPLCPSFSCSGYVTGRSFLACLESDTHTEIPAKKKKKEIVCEKWRRRYLIFRGICFLWLVDKVVDWPGRCSLRTFKDFYFSLYLLATMPPSLVYPRWWEYLFVANLKRQGERERERERKVNWGQVYDEGHSPCR